MGRGWLWALDKRGDAYRLSASVSQRNYNIEDETLSNGDQDQKYWQQTNTENIRFRKLAASVNYAWAIGSNSKPYLFVYGSDCPVRITEEVYENQRWYPLTGFTSHLLPTDRSVWSDSNGNDDIHPENRLLPSPGWEWEDPWTPECNPRLADKEGWMYASDFKRSYSNHTFTTAFVRRRRWIRTRRYVGVDRWINISMPLSYRILDIAVGGTEIPGQVAGFLSVWLLATNGKLLVRSGISRSKPEGEMWYEIDCPPHVEFNQLTCSPSNGALWAVTWEGRLFRRTGQQRTDFIGSGWAELAGPADLRFLNVSLDDHVVWAITGDGRTWFSKVNLDSTNEPINATSWVDMTCSMSYLSVGLSDQVFGIGLVDDVIYFRSGVTEKEPSGRMWQAVVIPTSKSMLGEEDMESNLVKFQTSERQLTEVSGLNSPVLPSPNIGQFSGGMVVKYNRSDFDDDIVNITDNQGDSEETGSHVSRHDENENDNHSEYENERVASSSDDAYHSTSEIYDKEDSSDTEISSVIASSNQSLSNQWILVNAGGCILYQNSNMEDGPPGYWFDNNYKSASYRRLINFRNHSWRRHLLYELKQRNVAIWTAFNDFALAFDGGVWTRTLSAQLWSPQHRRWCDVLVQFAQSWQRSSPETEGLTVKFVDSKKSNNNGKAGVVKLCDILCIRREFDNKANKFLLVLFIRKISGDPGMQWDFPLKFACQSEDDQKSWTEILEKATICYQDQTMTSNIDIRPANAIWAVSHTGAVYVCEPNSKCLIKDVHWRSLGGHFRMVEAGAEGIVYALGHDGRLWTYFANGTGQSQDDVVLDVIYENQRWSRLLMKYVPLPRLMCGSYFAWSDVTGRVDASKEHSRLPGSDWQWIDDWKVDFSIDCDPEGWQYSRSFSHAFYSTKKFRYSLVRRRRWIRKRRVVSSTGLANWIFVDSATNDTSRLFKRLVVSSDEPTNERKDIHVFAVTIDGDLLCRTGVNATNPEGLCWRHVITGVRVLDVSLGVESHLWIVGENGFVYCCYSANNEDLLSSGWREVLPPKDSKLRQIAAGNYVVYALDNENRLYTRAGVTPWCPEGVCWISLPSSTATVEHISVSKSNDLWALLKSKSPSGSIIARRYDIRGHGIITDIDWWDMSDVDKWIYVSARNSTSSLCQFGFNDKFTGLEWDFEKHKSEVSVLMKRWRCV